MMAAYTSADGLCLSQSPMYSLYQQSLPQLNSMVDRYPIRTMFMYFDATYDLFLFTGLAILTYDNYQSIPRIEAPEGQVLVINRPIIGRRLVYPGYKALYMIRLGKVFHVPYFSNEVIKSSIPNNNNNLLQFQWRMRLHAKDPSAAADKYGSSLRQKYIQNVETFFREQGKDLRITSKNEQKIRQQLQYKLRERMQYDLYDRNVLKELYIEKIAETEVGRRVTPEVL